MNEYAKSLLGEKQSILIATGPHGFPGASQIMCQTLREFGSRGHQVIYVGSKRPFLFNFLDPRGVEFNLVDRIEAEAIGNERAIESEDVLLIGKLADKIIYTARANIEAARIITVW